MYSHMRIPAILRFFAKTRYSDNLYEGTPCVEWVAYKNHRGYGKFGYQGKSWYAHVWIYQYFYGTYPSRNEAGERLEINHLCSNRACVNISHLELTTTAGNNLHENSSSIAKLHADKPCCPKCGRDYSVYTRRGGRVERICISCKREYNRAYMRQWLAKKRSP